jgi:hypothetical protein
VRKLQIEVLDALVVHDFFGNAIPRSAAILGLEEALTERDTVLARRLGAQDEFDRLLPIARTVARQLHQVRDGALLARAQAFVDNFLAHPQTELAGAAGDQAVARQAALWNVRLDMLKQAGTSWDSIDMLERAATRMAAGLPTLTDRDERAEATRFLLSVLALPRERFANDPVQLVGAAARMLPLQRTVLDALPNSTDAKRAFDALTRSVAFRLPKLARHQDRTAALAVLTEAITRVEKQFPGQAGALAAYVKQLPVAGAMLELLPAGGGWEQGLRQLRPMAEAIRQGLPGLELAQRQEAQAFLDRFDKAAFELASMLASQSPQDFHDNKRWEEFGIDQPKPLLELMTILVKSGVDILPQSGSADSLAGKVINGVADFLKNSMMDPDRLDPKAIDEIAQIDPMPAADPQARIRLVERHFFRLMNKASKGFQSAANPFIREILNVGANAGDVDHGQTMSRSTLDKSQLFESSLTRKFKENFDAIPDATFGVENEMFLRGLQVKGKEIDSSKLLEELDPNYRYMQDTSLKTTSLAVPLEQATSILQTPREVQSLQGLLSKLDDWGAITNKTAGVHIHTGVGQWNVSTVLKDQAPQSQQLDA